MLNFHQYFFNIDISLIMTLTRLKFVVHTNKTHVEGLLSQYFDIVLSFCFIVCRRSYFRKEMRKISKVFCNNMKSRK